MKIVINAVFGLFSRLKHRQPSFVLLFWEQKQSKRNFPILTQNHGLTPLENPIWHPKNESQSFRYFSCLKHRQNTFSYSILTKKTFKNKLYNFESKSWVNHFGKNPKWHPKMKVFINALFGLFSRLKDRQKSFLILFNWQKQSKRNFPIFT